MSEWDGQGPPSEHDQLRQSIYRDRDILAVVQSAVTELNYEHRPQWVNFDGAGYTEMARSDLEPVGCVMCYPHDGNWPCTSSEIAEDLRKLLVKYAAHAEKYYNETLSDALDDGVIL